MINQCAPKINGKNNEKPKANRIRAHRPIFALKNSFPKDRNECRCLMDDVNGKCRSSKPVDDTVTTQFRMLEKIEEPHCAKHIRNRFIVAKISVCQFVQKPRLRHRGSHENHIEQKRQGQHLPLSDTDFLCQIPLVIADKQVRERNHTRISSH